MTDREVMKLALEALERSMEAGVTGIKVDQAITALHQALEQPDQFARLVRIMGTFDLSTGHADNWNDLLDSLESELRDVLGHYREALKVGQEPVTWRNAAIRLGEDLYSVGPNGYYNMTASQWLDWALSVVNTAPHKQPEQYDQTALELCDVCGWKTLIPDEGCLNCARGKPWVGLTDEDIAEGAKQSWVDKQAFESAVWWAEEKLKEKNT